MLVKVGLGLKSSSQPGSGHCREELPLPSSPSSLLSPADANRRAVVGKNRISSTRSVFLCGQITILFFPVPILYTLHTRRHSCVNSKLCRLWKLAILLISRGEFCSWTMHTEAVIPLTGLSFNTVCMFLAETTSWPSLQYLLIDAFNGQSRSHISSPACGLIIVPHKFDSLAMSELSQG